MGLCIFLCFCIFVLCIFEYLLSGRVCFGGDRSADMILTGFASFSIFLWTWRDENKPGRRRCARVGSWGLGSGERRVA